MYYYKQVTNNKIVSVEAKSVDIASPDFTKATLQEVTDFKASLPAIIPQVKRDLAAEIDELKARLDKAGYKR